MATLRTISNRAKALGIVLIVIVGFLNFHVPHFLIEPATSVGDGSYLLELVFLTNLLGAPCRCCGHLSEWSLGLVPGYGDRRHIIHAVSGSGDDGAAWTSESVVGTEQNRFARGRGAIRPRGLVSGRTVARTNAGLESIDPRALALLEESCVDEERFGEKLNVRGRR
jgi:hypothetical protein